MGILNVTPDSFSDGGAYDSLTTARQHAVAMLDQGADILDIGGESTRPGSQRIDAHEQIRRVVPIIRAVRQLIEERQSHAFISVDTTRASVAQAALDAGADILNDIAAGLEDPDMLALAARTGAPIVLMHMQGQPATMQAQPQYNDVLGEVKAFLLARAQAAIDAGVARSQIILDPGIGFGKTLAHNLTLMAHLDELVATGYPILLGSSRKRYLGMICQPQGQAAPPSPATLMGATCATTVLAVQQGVQIIRVHDVLPNRQAADVAFAIAPAKQV